MEDHGFLGHPPPATLPRVQGVVGDGGVHVELPDVVGVPVRLVLAVHFPGAGRAEVGPLKVPRRVAACGRQRTPRPLPPERGRASTASQRVGWRRDPGALRRLSALLPFRHPPRRVRTPLLRPRARPKDRPMVSRVRSKPG